MNRLLNGLFKPAKAEPCFLRIFDSGYDPPDPKTPVKKSGASTAANISLLTSTGGLIGTNLVLLTPFYNAISKKYYFTIYDSSNFDTEEDCVYNFKMEDVQSGRNIDIHKVYLQYRDIGKVKFTVTVFATQYNKVKKTEKIVSDFQEVSVGTKKGDGKIHSYFVDLKVTGERPQCVITRKAADGPLAIVMAKMIGDVSEEQQI